MGGEIILSDVGLELICCLHVSCSLDYVLAFPGCDPGYFRPLSSHVMSNMGHYDIIEHEIVTVGYPFWV